MSPHTVINVTVVGSEDRDYREFRGKLVTVYTDEEGYSWAKSLASIEGAVRFHQNHEICKRFLTSVITSSRSKRH